MNRLDDNLIDQKKKITFSFNGKTYHGYQGDSLASALLANGVKLFGRSFKYHRPRGVISAGSEEPNALMTIGTGAHAKPNTRATMVEIHEGLEAFSQNHIGSLKHDFQAVNDFLSPLFASGFYYKTFMWPKSFWEKLYEPAIRRAAGLGKLSMQEDPDHYDKGFLHCDLLIIGAGLAGLSAALQAGKAGARVILADEDFELGGRLIAEGQADAMNWRNQCIKELSALKNVKIMPRTTIIGAYDHGVYGAVERMDQPRIENGAPRQILWRIYSKRAILATGALERPMAFPFNDRPGIMLAGAVRSYIHRYGVLPGKRFAIFTNNDDGWKTLRALQEAGAEIPVMIDTRGIDPLVPLQGTLYRRNGHVIKTKGRLALKEIKLSTGEKFKVDTLAISGGWNPNLHLSAHQGARPIWNETIASFTPGTALPPGMLVAGAAAGLMDSSAILESAKEAVTASLEALGLKAKKTALPDLEPEHYKISPCWEPAAKGRAWLDFQNDVTVKDVKLSYKEGFRSVEHLKRYTTLGMATDQGKTANVNAMAIMAGARGQSIAETGTTMFRPPYTPVAMGALAGRSRGTHFKPTRLTPSHQWAKEQGAEFVEVGMWLRAQYFPQAGETHWRQSVDREVNTTRQSVGICDVTTLGKIDIQGRDAAEFLNIVYANAFGKLPIGKVRYGLMLREDGMAMDDGTTARFSETHFVMTTTTANAVNVFRHMEFVRQCLRPDMDVHLISTTESWAQFAVAGPNARKLLQKIVDPEFDISNEAFPFMACGEITICKGTPARLFRISFSGELAYEIAVPARLGDALMREMMKAGEEFGAAPYGTEALGVMRIEKGHAAGNELNGQTTAAHLGMKGLISSKKDCIGKTMAAREELVREDGIRLVGFLPKDKSQTVRAGAHLIAKDKEVNMENDEGWISSACYSPSIESSIGIGFLKSGDQRLGETVKAVNPIEDEEIEVEVVSAHFVDPEGERLRM